MKGIILAGGMGTRLYPVTRSVCKQLLPIYDKPMIYYSLSVLLMAGIREILLISTPHDLSRFEQLLGDGSGYGIHISYAPQLSPQGIGQAFHIGKEFIGTESVALILGDNLFYGHAMSSVLSSCYALKQGAIIFGYEVKDPQRYGVIVFDEQGRVEDIVEKPQMAVSNVAVPGLYFYDHHVVEVAEALVPSKRGEYEITDINRAYLSQGSLEVRLLDRGFAWLDTGTPLALQQAAQYVQTIQERQGISIGCLEEVAYQQGFISAARLEEWACFYGQSEYGVYLDQVLGRNCSVHTLRG